MKKFLDKFTGYMIAVGNHELSVENNYYKVFEKDLFYYEFENFIIIAANFSNSNWLPSENQIKQINEIVNSSNRQNIILLSHQIFWYNQIDYEINPNSFELLETDLSKSSLEWLDTKRNKNYIIISGDYGAFGQKTACHVERNKIFIANGIGNLEGDTLLKIYETHENIFIEELNIEK